MYYRGAQAAIVVYDITNMVSAARHFPCPADLLLQRWVPCSLGRSRDGVSSGLGAQSSGGSKPCSDPSPWLCTGLSSDPGTEPGAHVFLADEGQPVPAGEGRGACPDHCLLSLPQDTFVRAKNWVKELQRQASPNIVIALAGNKADLASKRAVDFQVRRNPEQPLP